MKTGNCIETTWCARKAEREREREREREMDDRKRKRDEVVDMLLADARRSDEEERSAIDALLKTGDEEVNTCWWTEIFGGGESDIPSDEEAALEMLLRDGWRLPLGTNGDSSGTVGANGTSATIPMATEAQLYTVLEDRTAVDKALVVLARRGAVVRLRLASLPDDFALVRSRDVVRLLAAAAHERRAESSHAVVMEAMRIFAMVVLDSCRGQVEVPAHALQETFMNAGSDRSRARANACISILLNAGFLRRRNASDNETFFFSVPGIGKFVSSIIKARSAVFAAIKRRRYPEILERELRRQKALRASGVGLDFVLRDMKGGGHIVELTSASGPLLRLGRIR